MKLKLALATATSMGLLMSAAYGDDNVTPIKQVGDENNVLVIQGGPGGNYAGGPGSSDTYLNQLGDHNDINITQTGSGNEIGVENRHNAIGTSSHGDIPTIRRQPGWESGPTRFTRTNGVDQIGNYNVLNIEQTGGGNGVGTVQQIGSDTATATTNSLTIIQSNTNPGYSSIWSRHGVNDVYQENTSAGTDAAMANVVTISQTGEVSSSAGGYYKLGGKVYTITQKGHTNNLNITQDGRRNVVTTVEQDGDTHEAIVTQNNGNDNWVGSVRQLGTSHYAKVTQSGTGNVVVSILQDNTGGGLLGNSATLSFQGDYNGVGTFTGNAASIGLELATVRQFGDDNLLTYDVIGNDNLFAFDQSGDGNEIEGHVDGDGNQVAIAQSGGNNYAFTQQNGNNNNIGVSQ